MDKLLITNVSLYCFWRGLSRFKKNLKKRDVLFEKLNQEMDAFKDVGIKP